MSLKYFFDPLSQPSRAVYIFLKIANIPFEPCPVKIVAGEHRTEEFKEKYSKFQRLPFIHHNGFRLNESVAIVRYLSKLYKIPGNWYPNDSKAQAEVDEYLEWHHLGLRYHCYTHIWTSFLIPMMTGRTPSEKAIQKTKKNLSKALKDFERLFLSENKKYIVGDQISFADLQAACEIDQLKMVHYDVQEETFPKIKIWIENVKKECYPHYQELQREVDELADVYQQTVKSKL
ncbi:unnamed protein product [Callosobruchus maculatus]|uniref:Uncharacterized protein n=1 Tax=Callosobruchus maculatus TaxID=64391 RepID=A0A653C8H4_CALMS|nr:unnamed protein product [Callosobruchus maculatus]